MFNERCLLGLVALLALLGLKREKGREFNEDREGRI
jgi:hypothetical protein